MRLVLAGVLVVTLVGCGGHSKSATNSQKPTKPGIRVRLTADSHHPRVGKPWTYEVQVTDTAGKPVAASIHVQIVFGGVAVGQIGRYHVTNGVWRETIGAGANQPFPSRARGVPLAFEAIVKAKGLTRKVDYSIQVR
ncbi:MAG: hypothetical protein WBB76_08380 [Gaiellaceae bacterium]